MVKFGHLYRLKLKGAHFSQLLRQRSIFWKSWDCLSYNCMQVYPDILACKYIRVHFLRFQSLQNTKYPLILACNTKRGNWVHLYFSYSNNLITKYNCIDGCNSNYSHYYLDHIFDLLIASCKITIFQKFVF